MTSIQLENLGGYWVVITPRQVYEFPSHELARNFYISLLKNLGEPVSESDDALNITV
jgi:hypothetical protein